MSARDDLEDLMIGTYGMPDEKASSMLDAYAHELAEQIRATGGDPPGYTSTSSKSTYRWWAKRMAKVIDPEVP